jgi:hypothetical protein
MRREEGGKEKEKTYMMFLVNRMLASATLS